MPVKHRLLLLICLLFLAVPGLAGACEAAQPESFAPFFTRFAADKGFAVSRTQYPLQVLVWEYGVDAGGKDASAARRSQVSRVADAKAPSLSASMRDQGLTSRPKHVGPRTAVVEVFKPDTDWLMTYHFRRLGRCWYLQEFQNHSL